jgi:hypothetical protein
MSPEQPATSSPASAPAPNARPKGFVPWILEWNARQPVLAIVLVSFLAVVINCYPIIFCGKSYVSPACVNGTLVYEGWPPLPGMEKGPPPNVFQHASDTAAMMWWGVPMGFVESRSLLEHGELPLWNRYGHAGDTLIGQAVSMLGDPLHLIVILGKGSALAWDIKFLAAKFLFCVGFGLLIRRLLNNGVLSLIFTALAAYCGAYFYINNHPVFFVFAYAPWILLSAMEWLDLRSGHPIRWGLIWLLANFACFNAGHVEVAVDLIAGLNLAALVYALISYRSTVSSAQILIRMGAGTLFFLGLTAPMWMSFLVSLEGSFTVHATIGVAQLPPTALPGAFDDLLYFLLRPDDNIAAFAPGTSLLVLVGCSFSISRWRQLKEESFFWINTVAILFWGGCIFGWVPSSLLDAVPLLNRVGHIYTDFSYLLVMHLTIQSAYGFKCLVKMPDLRQMMGDLICVGGSFTGMILLYSLGYWHRPILWDYFLCAGAGAIGAPLLFIFLKSRQQQNLALGWAGIIILSFIPNFRFGLYSHNGNDNLLMFPGSRAVLNASSQAIDKIKLDKSAPFRVVGLQQNFAGDYSAVYELEDIRSCAPLGNGELVKLLRSFPGFEHDPKDWMVQVIDPIKAQTLLNMLNVKYLLTAPDVSIGEQTRAAIQRGDLRIADRSDFAVLENSRAWPRAFFASQIASIATSEEFIKYLLANGRQPFIALTPQELAKQPGLQPLVATNQPAMSPATNYRLSVNSTGFDVHAASAGVVCLTEGQAKDFTATANGEPKEILTVNRAFKGIYLDQPGDYHIEFTYRPHHWLLACTLFWISIGGMVIVGTLNLIRVKGGQKKLIYNQGS